MELKKEVLYTYIEVEYKNNKELMIRGSFHDMSLCVPVLFIEIEKERDNLNVNN